jgi:hypothetical protein
VRTHGPRHINLPRARFCESLLGHWLEQGLTPT